mgnify:FL=1
MRVNINEVVNIKEILGILDNSKVVAVKRVKPKNLTFTVLKGMSVRNYLKTCGK